MLQRPLLQRAKCSNSCCRRAACVESGVRQSVAETSAGQRLTDLPTAFDAWCLACVGRADTLSLVAPPLMPLPDLALSTTQQARGYGTCFNATAGHEVRCGETSA